MHKPMRVLLEFPSTAALHVVLASLASLAKQSLHSSPTITLDAPNEQHPDEEVEAMASLLRQRGVSAIRLPQPVDEQRLDDYTSDPLEPITPDQWNKALRNEDHQRSGGAEAAAPAVRRRPTARQANARIPSERADVDSGEPAASVPADPAAAGTDSDPDPALNDQDED